MSEQVLLAIGPKWKASRPQIHRQLRRNLELTSYNLRTSGWLQFLISAISINQLTVAFEFPVIGGRRLVLSTLSIQWTLQCCALGSNWLITPVVDPKSEPRTTPGGSWITPTLLGLLIQSTWYLCHDPMQLRRHLRVQSVSQFFSSRWSQISSVQESSLNGAYFVQLDLSLVVYKKHQLQLKPDGVSQMSWSPQCP